MTGETGVLATGLANQHSPNMSFLKAISENARSRSIYCGKMAALAEVIARVL